MTQALHSLERTAAFNIIVLYWNNFQQILKEFYNEKLRIYPEQSKYWVASGSTKLYHRVIVSSVGYRTGFEG